VIAPESFADSTGLRGTTDRASYLIDRFRIIYEFGGGWTCGCREFASQDSCKHTREVGIKYRAVPWATVAEMLDRNRLLVDRSNLENAPMLPSAKPEPPDENWRREAESYWNGKVVAQ
jgi:hypothetical protein